MAFADIDAPEGLRTDEFLLRPILASDAEIDYPAVMETKEFLRIWEGGGYPPDDFTVDDNRKDLAKMEGRFNDRHSFAYTVMNLTETECFGCVYIFPTDVSWLADTEVAGVGDSDWSDYDAVVQFWIRTSRLAEGVDRKLVAAMQSWLTNEWPFTGHVLMTSEPLDQQIGTIKGAGLELKFRLTDIDEDGEPDVSVAYA